MRSRKRDDGETVMVVAVAVAAVVWREVSESRNIRELARVTLSFSLYRLLRGSPSPSLFVIIDRR